MIKISEGEGEGGEREINSPSQSTMFNGRISHHEVISDSVKVFLGKTNRSDGFNLRMLAEKKVIEEE